MKTKNNGSGNTQDILDMILESTDNIGGLKDLASQFLNSLMEKEREIQLRSSEDNKGNGFYERGLSTGMGNLDLIVPRDRLGDFRPFFLPKSWKRSEDSYDQLLLGLIMNAYSPNKIKNVLKKLNLPYSPNEIDELKNDLYEQAKSFKQRQLPESAFAIFIDAYHTDAKDEDAHIKKLAVYSVVAITMEGKKEIFGFYDFFGSENRGNWLIIFNDLIKRGLKKFLLIASDDFPGIPDAIKTLFPKADHQLCFVHLQRNIKKNMSKEDYKTFKNSLFTISHSNDFDSAVSEFSKLCEKFKDKYPSFISHIFNNKEKYLNYLKYPAPIRKHIYTTNAVENINSRLEVVRINNGGYFQSIKTLTVSTFILAQNITKNRWTKSMVAFKESEYEINQLFNLKYFPQTQSS